MCHKKLIASAILVLLIAMVNPGKLIAAHGGGGMGGMGGGSFHGGMGGMSSGFHGGMGGMSSSFRGGMSSGMHSFATPGFNGSFRNFSYSPQHFNAAPRVNGNFTSRVNPNSFNNAFHSQQFNYRNNTAFDNNSIMRNQHPVNPQAWNHNNNWWRNNFAYDRRFDHDHDHDFNHFHSFIFSPFLFPLWDYGPFYSWYGYPYYSDYYYNDYSPGDYYYYSEPYAYTSDVPVVQSDYSTVPNQYPGANDEPAAASGDWGDKYLSSARDAFLGGDYSDALRLANHAVVETPKNAKAHELMSLALFALKDFRGANIEAHAALSLGPASDWATLYSYYNDLPTYTKQLDALVDYIHDHKDAMDARFVLSYQDIMMGHKDAAKSQLEDIVAKIPKDQVAQRLLKELGGSPPAAIENPPQGSNAPQGSGADRSASTGGNKQL
jgi:hypothetical protein